MNQKRVGILITYANLVMGMVVNVFLTPFLIKSLGDVDYSIYKVMQSFAGPLTMFHLGVSTIVARSIVGRNDSKEEKRNTLAHALLASTIMAILVIAVAVAMYLLIPSMYGETYSADSIATGQKMFVLFAASSVLHLMTDAFSGCMLGHERFIVSSSLALGKTLGKMLLYVVFIKCGFGVVSIVTADLILAAGTFGFSVCYAVLALREIPRMSSFDKKQMLEILSFGFAILLQAFVNQVNNNVDTIVLGVYAEEKWIITMYSSALAIYSIYNSLVSTISHFFLPDAAKLVNRGASGAEITDFVIQRGRLQAIIAVACICGFALFGRNFIRLWIGERYADAYAVILMLMIPVTIPLVENSMISILDATLKRIVRSAVLVAMAVINVLLSIWLVQIMGFWGAALGTVASLIIGHGVIMNLYYYIAFQLDVIRMFRNIFKGILPAGILAAAICVPAAVFLPESIIFFVIKCVCYLVVFAVFLYLFGLEDAEKKRIRIPKKTLGNR